MKLTILLAGETPDALMPAHGPYAPRFEAMLNAHSETFRFDTVQVHRNAPLPDPRDLEGVIVSGSAFGAYDAPPWMEPLRRFIRDAYRHGLPMLGICFGHQIMADALGGRVEKSQKGWSIGRHVYRLAPCPECFLGEQGEEAAPGTLAVAASHQDQVIEPPACARVFLSSDFTPNAGLIYDNGRAMSLQPHPEFEVAYSRAICELRRNNPMDDMQVDRAVASLDAPLDNARVGRALARFFVRAGKVAENDAPASCAGESRSQGKAPHASRPGMAGA
ncbi:MAG TPA: type 1 glutamine amidotransferase [Devosia sp.]|nr:type 1 glutamine amidotransferase [Devosia sp.]